ncbi:mitogen activated protein kinase [Ceratobasidium sp. AG-Ba]|nr:mitogen activated protein kinase [Ceratobasidium sp. AG-Ba]
MILDFPPELLNAIFQALDDPTQRKFTAVCRAFRETWLIEAWQSLTLTGRNVKSQLNRLVNWIEEEPQNAQCLTDHTHSLYIRACLLSDDVPAGEEGEHNMDIVDGDIYPLLNWLCSSLKVLAIDLPPTHDTQFFDTTLRSIVNLTHLERLFLGRVKVDEGYEIECQYTSLKEATMIWCHGIVEQRLLINQPMLEYLDVHDSWDIGNLSLISHQWHNLKSFRFSAIDPTYAIRILENGRGAMTSLQDVSIEVPMSEFTFDTILDNLAGYPVRRFHISLSAEGLGVFQVYPSGQNKIPDKFSPEWLKGIGASLKDLEELVLDYRLGGVQLGLVWPGLHSAYASAMSNIRNLQTLAISIHAIHRPGKHDYREIAQEYMEHIPTLRALHFPAMPIYPPHLLSSATNFDSSATSQLPVPAETSHVAEVRDVGYSLFRISGDQYESPTGGDHYSPFWISRGIDVAVDRHRRAGGLPIVGNDYGDMELDDNGTDPELFEDPNLDNLVDLFDQDDFDLAPWFHDNLDDDSHSDEAHDEPQHVHEAPEDWMDQLIIGMSNVGVAQLDLSILDGHDSDDGILEDQEEDQEDDFLSEDFGF